MTDLDFFLWGREEYLSYDSWKEIFLAILVFTLILSGLPR